VGGVLLEQFWWGSAFLLGVPFMVLLLVAGPMLLPEFRDTEAGRLDPTSVALSLAAILLLIYGLKELARDGGQPLPVASVVVGLVVGIVFVHRQRALTSPLLDLRLFASRTFSSALSIMLLGGVVMAGISLLSTMYMQLVHGLSPLDVGLWLVPQNVAMIIGFMLAPAVAHRVRAAYVCAGGLALAGVGLLLHTQVESVGGLGLLVTGLTLASFGISLPMALTMGMILAAAPAEKAGSAGEFGIALGIATLGSLGTVVYRNQLAGTVPTGVPDQAVDTAGEGVTAAVAAAQHLPGPLSADLLDAARAAFIAGLNVVGGVGAAIFLGLAITAAAALRHVRAGDEAGQRTLPDADVETADVVRSLVGGAEVDCRAGLCRDQGAGGRSS
jgi:MFS transporter, DHA2 family, multidrug resistance protein